MTHLFYGDIFKIEDIGCLFFGYGKTQAGRTAINDNEEQLISLDMARIDRVDKILYGSNDYILSVLQVFGADILKCSPILNKNVVNDYISNTSPIPDKNVEIKLLIRCLNEEETNKIFNSSPVYIKEVDSDAFIGFSLFNIEYMNTSNALEIFKNLIFESRVKKYVLVPWMNSHDEKGRLIKEYIINDFKN